MRSMRHAECLMSREETERLLAEENWGVLCVHGDDGYPYGVPMNYAWCEGRVLLHCTSDESHRLDALKRDSKVCFTVVPVHRLDRDNWGTEYASIVIFGSAEIISRPEEKLRAMREFMKKLSPEKTEEALLVCDPSKADMVMIAIHPEAITGKKSS